MKLKENQARTVEIRRTLQKKHTDEITRLLDEHEHELQGLQASISLDGLSKLNLYLVVTRRCLMI